MGAKELLIYIVRELVDDPEVRARYLGDGFRM